MTFISELRFPPPPIQLRISSEEGREVSVHRPKLSTKIERKFGRVNVDYDSLERSHRRCKNVGNVYCIDDGQCYKCVDKYLEAGYSGME